MPVLSYLAFPAAGRKDDLVSELEAMPECEVIESESDDDLLIVVTETDGEDAERKLEKRLDKLESLAMLTLVFGHRADSLARKEIQS